MHIMLLINKTLECAAHRDHIIIRMRAKNDNALRIWVGTLRAVCVIGIRLTSGPASDSVLEIVEYLYVHIVCRAKKRKQFTETPIVVILVGKLKDRLAGHLTEPHDGAADELVVPLARCDLPGL